MSLPERQSGHRIWFIIAVFLSTLTILDLLKIVGESFITELPDSVRCQLVEAALSLPFNNEYNVRRRTNCPG
jgi:hypothetical protein